MAPRIKYDRVSYVDPHPGKEDYEILWDSACTRCGGSGEFREFDHKEAAKANIAPVVEGKQVISGTVYGTKSVDGIYGITYKFGIRTESGQTYWGTIPKKLMALEILATGDWESKLNGTQVSLKADVSPSRDDHTHGFYKRPTLVSADLLNS